MNSGERRIKPAKKVFQTKWFSIESVSTSTKQNPYYRLSCSDSVSILAQTKSGKIILVRQYRPAIETFSLEMPSGYVDKDESTEEAIARELKEETGFICGSIKRLATLKIVPSRINNTLHVFYGGDAKLSEARVIGAAETELVLVTPSEFKKLVLAGKYVETAGIAMFYLAKQKGYL